MFKVFTYAICALLFIGCGTVTGVKNDAKTAAYWTTHGYDKAVELDQKIQEKYW